MDFSLIIPCYNEIPHLEPNLERVFSTLRAGGWQSEVILVDDTSRDGTLEAIDRVLRRHAAPPALRVIAHPENLGRGAAVRTGAAVARGRFAGFLDIDLEVDCAYLPVLISALERGADLVIGRRAYAADGRPMRVVLSRGYRALSRAVLRHPIRDTECGFKLFRMERMGPLIARTRERGWFWDTEVVYRAWQAGLRIEEVPVRFERRLEKASTVRPVRDSLDYLARLGRFRWQLALERVAGAAPAVGGEGDR
jgi:glycosyltransferase involved in cell wall biosynthesis